MKVAVILLIGAIGAAPALADAGPWDGATVFKARCAKCHGESGKTDTAGVRALKVRPLANDAELARLTPAEIAQAIKSNTKHRGVGAVIDLDDAEIEAAAIYVKELARKPR